LRYLAYCIAPSVNAVQERATDTHTSTRRAIATSHALAALIGFDMAKWWSASAENYFGAVSKAKLAEAVREAKGDEVAARIEKLKKGDGAKAAERELDGSRWLPTLLRQV
jgi:ParB family chromosome partitioning protein